MNTPTIIELYEKFGKKVKLDTFTELQDTSMCLLRHCFIGDVDESTGEAVDLYIRYWNLIDDAANIPVEEREPIKIYINSYGGVLTAAFQIINAIEQSTTPVYTICTGTAYSSGFFIFISGHKRFAYPYSSFLYHEGSVMTGGDANKFRNFADFYNKQLKILKTITIKYTDITEEEYDNHSKDDWWFTAEEALEKNICDEITTKTI